MTFPHSPIVAGTLLAALLLPAATPAQRRPWRRRTCRPRETTKAYRMDAARHIYAAYPEKIYKGKLPPLVHGIVVSRWSWTRAAG
jgi:hypothetical protein